MNIRRAIVCIAAVVLFASCGKELAERVGEVKKRVDAGMQQVQSIGEKLIKHYPKEQVNVMIEGRSINISFVNSPLLEASDEDRRKRANEVYEILKDEPFGELDVTFTRYRHFLGFSYQTGSTVFAFKR